MSERDIVEWLRQTAPDARAMDPSDWTGIGWPIKNGLLAAADEIERLRAELKAATDE